ncbi:Septum formation protein Maf [Alteracholeplasma palmae J233]|uniref:dTTP/UTP pyrophosphatase n=1 Tax=Alteracholeplasma palmae (strain ATCC 49389 / J233) TaxID=1318466 RepID=U4KSF8_ALTPJ|nr:Maf family protein [Alteracholeplasma palmae]CCV64971.1 Septum formation protein Maf [Alteracholeplasma palmae J233]
MIILASQSPRRKQLLEEAGVSFKIVSPDFDEKSVHLDKTDPKKYVSELAYKKASDVLEKNQEDTVIGADTVVVLENEVLEKPIDEEDAFRMLKKLSGKKHQVITGVAILKKGIEKVFTSVASVYFKELTDFEITEYIASKEPMDKAGSYAIQGIGSKLIERHEGDLFTIIGLPLKEVLQTLKTI